MPQASSPIGVFDSGVGGLSVLRALLAAMPHERFVYLADSANAPVSYTHLTLPTIYSV